jgi:hypothetical protein
MPPIARILLSTLFAVVFSPLVAQAQQAEAKQAAQDANCKPGKVEVLKQVNGRMPETLYKILCTGQKSADGKEVFIVIQCRERTCVAAR